MSWGLYSQTGCDMARLRKEEIRWEKIEILSFWLRSWVCKVVLLLGYSDLSVFSPMSDSVLLLSRPIRTHATR